MSSKYFHQLFIKHYDSYVRFANSYVRNLEIAEDITTDAFMSFWEKRKEIKVDTNCPAYILTSVKHGCLSYLRKEKTKNKASKYLKDIFAWELTIKINTLEICDPHDLFAKEIKIIIDETIEKMPARTREIYLLSREKYMSNLEIAKALDVTVKGIEYHMTKALSMLEVSLRGCLSFLFFFI